jgi:hypothetical protein
MPSFTGGLMTMGNYTGTQAITGRATVSAIGLSSNYGLLGACFDGTNVWIGPDDYNHQQVVYKINGTTGATIGTYATGVPFPMCIVFDGTYIWILGYNGTNFIIGNMTLGGSAGTRYDYASVFDYNGSCFDGTKIWTTNTVGELLNFNVSTHAFTLYDSTGVYGAMCYDGTHIWTWSGAQNLVKINPATGSVIWRSAVYSGGSGGASQNICFDGTYIWALGYNNDVGSYSLIKINPSLDTIVGAYSDGLNGAMAVAYYSPYIWTTGSYFCRFYQTTGKFIDQYNGPNGDQAVQSSQYCVGNSTLWATCFGESTLYKVNQ